ncbi:Restriction endonuclease NotI [compost metagenome]
MAVKISEYHGKVVDYSLPLIQPADGSENCPFMNSICPKIKKGLKPICSVQKPDGENWIVCSNRLCSTLSNIPLSNYQIDVLSEVAKCVFGDSVDLNDIVIKREITMPVVAASKYHADYVMMNIGNSGRANGQRKFVLEMQGGGETSSTGAITRLVENWEKNPQRSNLELSQMVAANPIVTNAWRRQQEQFIVKGNIAHQTGGGLVFCVGGPLYDYLYERVKASNLRDLKDHNWTLALIAFHEEYQVDGTIKYVPDNSRQLFTNYVSFLQVLINQGGPHPELFSGKFEKLLTGMEILI